MKDAQTVLACIRNSNLSSLSGGQNSNRLLVSELCHQVTMSLSPFVNQNFCPLRTEIPIAQSGRVKKNAQSVCYGRGVLHSTAAAPESKYLSLAVCECIRTRGAERK